VERGEVYRAFAKIRQVYEMRERGLEVPLPTFSDHNPFGITLIFYARFGSFKLVEDCSMTGWSSHVYVNVVVSIRHSHSSFRS